MWYSKTTPRKGTETIHGADFVLRTRGLHLSPQGDGNRVVCGAFGTSMGLQFIPARGRRRISVIVHVCEIGNFSFSPQGDGNFSRYAFTFSSNDCNLPPQGDGNPPRIGFWLRLIDCNLSPQGDENSILATSTLPSSNCNLSPQGDGNTLRPGYFSVARILQFIPARGRKQNVGIQNLIHHVL